MSEPREKLDISDLKDTFLQCPVCVEHFNQTDRRPRLLHSCLHAFCTQCLHKLLVKEGKGQITCPLCRQVQKVTKKADNLPLDPVRGKLVEYVQIKHQKKVLCTDCPDEGKAEARCHECHIYVCTTCKHAHKRNKTTRKHDIVSLEEMLNEPIKNMMGHYCSEHPDHKIEFYCSRCNELCCLSCTVVKHKGHDLKAVQDVSRDKMLDLESQIAHLSITEDEIRKKRTWILETTAKEERKLVSSTTSINKEFDDIIHLLNTRRSSLLSNLKSTSEEIVGSLHKQSQATEDTLAVMDSVKEYFEHMKSKSDDCEILTAMPGLHQTLNIVNSERSDHQYQMTLSFEFPQENIKQIKSLISSLGEIKRIQALSTIPYQMTMSFTFPQENIKQIKSLISSLGEIEKIQARNPTAYTSRTLDTTKKKITAEGIAQARSGEGNNSRYSPRVHGDDYQMSNGLDIVPGTRFSLSRLSSFDDHHSGRSSRDMDASNTFNHFASLQSSARNPTAYTSRTLDTTKKKITAEGIAQARSGGGDNSRYSPRVHGDDYQMSNGLEIVPGTGFSLSRLSSFYDHHSGRSSRDMDASNTFNHFASLQSSARNPTSYTLRTLDTTKKKITAEGIAQARSGEGDNSRYSPRVHGDDYQMSNGLDIVPGTRFSLSRLSSFDDHQSGRSSRDMDASNTFNHFASLQSSARNPTSYTLRTLDTTKKKITAEGIAQARSGEGDNSRYSPRVHSDDHQMSNGLDIVPGTRFSLSRLSSFYDHHSGRSSRDMDASNTFNHFASLQSSARNPTSYTLRTLDTTKKKITAEGIAQARSGGGDNSRYSPRVHGDDHQMSNGLDIVSCTRFSLSRLSSFDDHHSGRSSRDMDASNRKRQYQSVFSDQISAETDSTGRYEGRFVMKTSRMDH